MRLVSGPLHGEHERQLESIGEGTRYRSRLVAESGGLFKLADPILETLLKRTVVTDLQTLKALLEAKVATRAWARAGEAADRGIPQACRCTCHGPGASSRLGMVMRCGLMAAGGG